MGRQVRRMSGGGAEGRQHVGQADHLSAGNNKRLPLNSSSPPPGEQGVSRAGAARACRTTAAVHKQLGLGREVCTTGGEGMRGMVACMHAGTKVQRSQVTHGAGFSRATANQAADHRQCKNSTQP